MIAFKRPRSPLELRQLVRTDPQWRSAAFVGLVGVITAIVLLLTPPTGVSYSAGVVADRSVRAPRTVAFASASLTEAERERAAAAVPKQYAASPSVVVSATTRMTGVIASISRLRAESTLTRDQRVAAASRLADVTLTPALAADAIDMTASEWDAVSRSLEGALQTLYAPGIRPEQLDQARADVPKALPAAWSDRQKRPASELLRQDIEPSVLFDQPATVAAQQAARNGVVPVQVAVTAGEVVVREGAVVTEQDVEKLRALGLSEAGIDWRGAAGLLLWAVLVAAALAVFVERYSNETWIDDRQLLLVALTFVTLTAVGRVLVPQHTVAVYFAPFAAAAMMLSVLVGGRAAIAVQIAGALHVGVMSGQVELVAYVLIPALLGMAAVRRATTAREFATAAAITGLGNLGVVSAFILVGRATDVFGVAQLSVAALVSGLLSGLLAFAGMAMLGHVFGITTVFELRELADPNHPLLRQLLLRTPGTYHHALLVANLSERAAEFIGADPLVARVGSYYHDIGKMRNPSAFIENQTGTNPHDELDPLVSAGIVAAHVRDGLALADRYRLPDRIREMIPAHHGTGAVRYFHQLAQQRGQDVNEEAFRYPGPRPRSKEAGIVMLADGTEASVRSLEEKTPDRIRAMVEKIIGERVAEGQLDECELTLANVQRIKDAFCELLVGVYHERIPYPEDRITQLPPADEPPAATGR